MNHCLRLDVIVGLRSDIEFKVKGEGKLSSVWG